MQGIVKEYDKERGFGFIETEDQELIFVHYTQLVMEGFKSIEVGTLVDFEIVMKGSSKQAHNVMRT